MFQKSLHQGQCTTGKLQNERICLYFVKWEESEGTDDVLPTVLSQEGNIKKEHTDSFETLHGDINLGRL